MEQYRNQNQWQRQNGSRMSGRQQQMRPSMQQAQRAAQENSCACAETSMNNSCQNSPSHRNDNDRMDRTADFMRDMPIGMSYVPMQHWRKIYAAEEGFSKGTIFAELDFPFKYGRCSRK